MNDLCVDIGWKSINHEGEQLCGDHVDIVEQDENSECIHRLSPENSQFPSSHQGNLINNVIYI